MFAKKDGKGLSSNDFTNELKDKLESLRHGTDGRDGKSAYEIALETGFVGSKEQWIASLKGQKGDDTGYNKAYVDNKYDGLAALVNANKGNIDRLKTRPQW